MDILADSALDHLTLWTATITENVSPRKPDLVGLLAIRDLLTTLGKLGEDGKPLSDARVAALLNRMEDEGVLPAYGSRAERNRLWYRQAVIDHFKDWDQKQGYPRGRPRPQWIRVEGIRRNNKLTRLFQSMYGGRLPYEYEWLQVDDVWYRFRMNDANEEWWERQPDG